MRELERYLLLEIIDQRWREHLYDLDYLQQGIGLRAAAQEEPLVAYKNEAFQLFGDLMNNIWGDFARMIFHVQVVIEGADGGAPADRHRRSVAPLPARAPPRAAGACRTRAASRRRARWPWRPPRPMRPGENGAEAYGEESMLPAPVEQRRVDHEHDLGRNDPCWCGSGKKFKKCHGA